MGKQISLAYYLEASAGDEGDVTIYTVEAARKFKCTSCRIQWQKDSAFELQLYLKHGEYQFAPREGYYASDGGNLEDRFEEDFSSGDRLILHYKNTNTTTTRKALVIVRGYLE